eukprot:3992338-Ditylum_brightwellii.AAC.1
MSNMWKKISYANKNKYESNVTSKSIPKSWPDVDTTITADCNLKDPKKQKPGLLLICQKKYFTTSLYITDATLDRHT